MQSRSDEAYVLSTFELGEADLLVTLLTREHGTVRAVARSARRSRRRFGGLLEPLGRVSAVWSERQGRELHRLDSLEGVRSFAAMQADPLTQAACAVLAELCLHFVQEGAADPRDFRLLGAVLEALEDGGDAVVLVRYFEYWLLRLHGLAPDGGRCAGCGRELPPGRPAWAVAGEGLRCGRCRAAAGARAVRCSHAERELLDHVRRVGPSALSGAEREAAAGAGLEVLLRGTLEAYAERRMRSYRHLKAMGRPHAPGGEG